MTRTKPGGRITHGGIIPRRTPPVAPASALGGVLSVPTSPASGFGSNDELEPSSSNATSTDVSSESTAATERDDAMEADAMEAEAVGPLRGTRPMLQSLTLLPSICTPYTLLVLLGSGMSISLPAC
jgi:hypothetical protein